MTYARREEIFSKEVITTSELAELLNLSYSNASTELNGIKRFISSKGGTPRILTSGKLHVQDYLDVFRLNGERYFISQKEEENNEY